MKSSLIFNDYVVNNIEFKNNISFDEKPVEIDFDIDSVVECVNERKFILGLEVELFREAEKNNYPYNFKVEVVGMFEVEEDIEETKIKFFETNAIAILFPYVRALITTFTSASNVQPVILPPINVVEYLKNKSM